MLPYERTPLAEEDLKDIARYTLTQWSKKQSLHYARLLEKRLRNIASGTAHSRTFSVRYPHVMVSRCEHHYMFYIHLDKKPVGLSRRRIFSIIG